MPMQQVEYEFPDPDKVQEGKEIEVETKEDTLEIEVEGAVGREELQKPKKEPTEVKVLEEDVDVEIIDDTPQADRGRKPSEPPEEVTDEELGQYSDKVKKRIKHFSKGYHDERRAKETAERQKEEAITYAQKLVDENKQLKGSVDKSHNSLIQSAKKQVDSELAIAGKQYKDAYESGEADAILTAQQALNQAQIRKDKVDGMRTRRTPTTEPPLQPEQNPVQSQLTPTQQPVVDEKAEAWREENAWFGSDDEMTAFALGVHTKLLKEGADLKSDAYYQTINSRMREVFPSEFDGENESVKPKPKSSNVVAPATRSRSPKKVTLSQTQVSLAKRLGVTLEDYAEQVAELMRKQI